jgi:hypothetical protein
MGPATKGQEAVELTGNVSGVEVLPVGFPVRLAGAGAGDHCRVGASLAGFENCQEAAGKSNLSPGRHFRWPVLN